MAAASSIFRAFPKRFDKLIARRPRRAYFPQTGSMNVPQHLRELNTEQQAAALATDGPVLILAGAGSGKTRTLVYRIVHLLKKGIDARRILSVTFTNRAAAEMRERVTSVIGKDAKGLTLSTFHSLGARILRDHFEAAGLPKKFSIYATGDQLALVKRVMNEEVYVAATAGEETYDAKRVLYQISSWKNQLLTPIDARNEVVEGATRGNRSDDYAILAADVYPRYQEALRAAGAVDFDDLLLLPVELLRAHMDVREALWRRWQYLMVDEYQDTNGAQLELARLLAGPHKNLCVVGDDDQSIYAWRGADLRNILDFERHFPGARVIILEENYRSSQRILEAANAVIGHNSARKVKRMRTANGLGPKLDYYEFDEGDGRTAEEQEAGMVAREIGVRRFSEQLQWSDFAVLYRTNLQARSLEEAMRAANLPYRVVGGTSYFDRKEIADAAAYLRALVNPSDEVALRRIINYPTRGIGRTTLLRLVEVSRERSRTLWDTLCAVDGVEGLSRVQCEAVASFVRLLQSARARLDAVEAAFVAGITTDETIESWLESFLRSLKLEEAIRQENRSDKVGQIRIDNLRDFVSSAGVYERRVWAAVPLPDEEIDWAPPTLAGFLERISLVNEEESKDDRDEEPNRVTLMTLHSAKGLEFAHVFLVGCEEEILPHARSVSEISEGGAHDPIAEERRLFYVGITRAQHRLTLSGCRTRRRGGEELPRQPSRFLKEIPTELVEHRSARSESSLTEGDRKDLRQNFFAQMKDMLGS
jgi:DNA helicase II / ATP-dependent DNA helicase PcrA